MIDEAGKEIKKKHLPDADALVLFSCVYRHVAPCPMISEEIDGLKKLWDVLLVGFFSCGEIGKAPNEKHELQNTTCCPIVLKEV